MVCVCFFIGEIMKESDTSRVLLNKANQFHAMLNIRDGWYETVQENEQSITLCGYHANAKERGLEAGIAEC